MKRIVTAVANRAAKLGAYLSFAAVLLLIAHVALDVCLRVLFNAPLSGTTTFVSYYYMVAIAFLSLGDIEQRDGHISVEAVFGMLPARAQWRLQTIVNIVVLAIFLLLMAKTLHAAIGNIGTFQNDGSSRIYTWPAYFFPPAGCLVIALVLITRILYPRVCDGAETGPPQP